MTILSAKPTRLVLRVLFYLTSIGFCMSLLIGAFYAGAFASEFSLNMCYSDALKLLAKTAEDTINSANAEQSKAYVEMVKKLPLHGYETDCYEVKNTLAKLTTKH